MATIRVFSDESFCNKKTFRIITTIWGLPNDCNVFEQEISNILSNNRSILGVDFKEFHAVNLNSQNWVKNFPVYDSILTSLFNMIKRKSLGLLIVVMSENRYNNNAGWLTEIVSKGMKDRTSAFGKLFSSLDEKDLPAFYYRMNQLFSILRYREIFGDSGDSFEFYPDSTGKALHYTNKSFEMSGTLQFSIPFHYNDIIQMLGDSFMKSFSIISNDFNFEGWPTIEQHLTKFQPVDSSSNFIIQSCDIVSNFVLSLIRHTVGLTEKNYELKSLAIQKYMDFNSITPDINSSFIIDRIDAICNNPSFWVNIKPVI